MMKPFVSIFVTGLALTSLAFATLQHEKKPKPGMHVVKGNKVKVLNLGPRHLHQKSAH